MDQPKPETALSERRSEGSLPVACPICGSATLELRYPAAHDYMTGHSFQVWYCSVCGAAHTHPQPQDLSQYYPTKYRRYSPPAHRVLQWLYHQRVQQWTKAFNQPGRVLEIGCGDGFMLHVLRQAGWDVLGVERTIDMARYAGEKFGVPVVAGDVRDLVDESGFDLVILYQVLEHLTDPPATLAQCARLLRPGGTLIIGVPNFGSWQSRFGRELWFHLDIPRHLFHYSPQSLAYMLQSIGLSIVNVQFVSFEHDPYGWLETILSRLTGKHNGLTTLMMQLEPWTVGSLFQVILACLLAPIAGMLALVSWMAGQGALIQVIGALPQNSLHEM